MYTQIVHGLEHGVTLAQGAWQGQFARLRLRLSTPLTMDDATSSGPDTTLESKDARQCLARSDTLAYIAPLNSRLTFVSEPILNDGGIVTISPSNTNSALTDPAQRAIQEPSTYRGTVRSVTYFRVIGTDSLQGAGAAVFLHSHLHARTYYRVVDFPYPDYGGMLAAQVDRYGSRLHLRRVGAATLDHSNAQRLEQTVDAVADQIATVAPNAVYCGCDTDTLLDMVAALEKRHYRGSLLTGDAIFGLQGLNPGDAGPTIFATNVGIDTAHTAGWFRRAYRARFHTVPQFYDAYAYDSASIALRAIYTAALHGELHGSLFSMRTAVLTHVAHTCYLGATGLTTFDRNGDTRNRLISIYTLKSRSWQFLTVSRAGSTPVCH